MLVCMLLIICPLQLRSASLNFTPYCTKVDFDDRDHPAQQESFCLQILKQSATRQGNVLSLKLDNGAFKTYASNPLACDNDDADHCVRYSLVGFHEAARLYIVLTAHYDEIDCVFVSAHDGTETKIGNLPHFAPDGLTFIVIFDLDGFAIGSVASVPPSLRRMDWAGGSNEGEYWSFQRWLDGDHIALRFDGQSTVCPDGNCEAVLVRTDNGWILQRKL
jgi:hypothetical protein